MTDVNYIVRVIGKELKGEKRIDEGIQGLKGISKRMGVIIANNFCDTKQKKRTIKLGELTKEDVTELEDFILHPEKHNIPQWALNRQKDYETGENKHLTMNELDYQIRTDFQKLADMKTYRGLRHSWGLTTRGQKTRSTHHGRGGTAVGVQKKDQKKK